MEVAPQSFGFVLIINVRRKRGPRVKLDGWMRGYIDARTGETYDTGSGGENDEMSDTELSKKAIGEKLDAAMACLNQVVKAERSNRLSGTNGNRRDGWSAKYAKVIADVTELVAVANEACDGANVAKLKKLMDKIAKLSEVLEINMDCTGMTQTNIHRTIKHAAKKSLVPYMVGPGIS
jgi:hypothetical protein